jgi:hypothetical protein
MISALFLVGSVALVGQTSAAEKINFAGADTFYPDQLFPPGTATGTIISPPTITCPGTEPLNPPPADPTLSPCPEGSRTHTRGYVIKTRFDTDRDLVTGYATILVNANFDADSNGPLWGTISIEPDAVEGTWDGTWAGMREKEGDIWVITIHASLQGHGGSLDRMLYRALDTVFAYTPTVLFYDGILEGWILDPHKK